MNGEKDKRSLQEVFSSTFHSKMSFEDFLSIDIQDEFKIIKLKKRIVYAPSPKLKQVHRFLNNTIFEYADFNTNVVFSYRKGLSTRNAVEIHSKSNFFFQTDISSFYSNIHLADVQVALSNQLAHTPVIDIDNYIDKIIDLIVVDNHIPAGFSTSPILSNICLLRFDSALLEYCKKENIFYTRYSDDLIISGDNDEFMKKIEAVIESLLRQHVNTSIRLNKSKTKTHKKGQKFKLLGFSILPNGIVTIPSTEKKEIETLLYLFLTDQSKFENYIENSIRPKYWELGDKSLREYGVASLSGRLIAFNSMDKKYLSKLRRKYGNTLIDMFIRKSVK